MAPEGQGFNEMCLQVEVLSATKPRRLHAVMTQTMAWVQLEEKEGGRYNFKRAPLLKSVHILNDAIRPYAWPRWGSERWELAASAGRVGNPVWTSSAAMARDLPLLHAEPFQTDMVESNLVMNVFYHNYNLLVHR